MDVVNRKRGLENEASDVPSKFVKLTDDVKLKTCLTWCKDNGLLISSKVAVTREGSCAQYGLIAQEDLSEGHCILDIPRSILLTPQTCAIAALLEKEKSSLESKSGWVPLLIALMYEYLKDGSHWAPYIHLVPDYQQLYLPMFWPEEDLVQNLEGTGVVECVRRDLSNISQEYQLIVQPFIQNHRQVFTSDGYNLDLYKKMVAFVMAYSFTEPPDEDDDDEETDETNNPGPMMVPMADILNHVANNNANLDFGKESLKMVATRPIKKGEEIYNTYGPLNNQELLHMYGFTEQHPLNTHETVEIPWSLVNNVLSKGVEDKALLEDKWCHLKSKEVLTEDFIYLLGTEGFVTDWEMYETLKIMAMDDELFKQVNEREEISDTEGEDAMSYDDIEGLPKSWKLIIEKIAEACLCRYRRNLADEESVLSNEVQGTLPNWKKYCVYLRHSHLSLLNKLLQRVKHK